MTKKPSSGIILLGWVLIVSNTLNILYPAVINRLTIIRPDVPPNAYMPSSLFIGHCIGSISARLVLLIFSYFPFGDFLSKLLVVFHIWNIALIILGVGLIRLKEKARKILVILLGFQITIFLFQTIIGSRAPLPFSSFGLIWNLLFKIVYFAGLFLPLAYLIYLTRPKVKAQFK